MFQDHKRNIQIFTNPSKHFHPKMNPRQLFDYLRLSLLVFIVLFTYSMSIRFIIKTEGFKSMGKWLLFLWEGLSCLYLLLTNRRRGYVDYEQIDASLGHVKFSKRYCRPCMHYKPERTHHCSTCDRCVKKMDHHCMWMSVCVNYDNHGDFVRFLFFTSISNLYILLCYSYNLFLFYKSRITLTRINLILLCGMSVVSLVLFYIPFLLLRIHLKLIIRNITFIEELTYSDYYLDENPYIIDRYSRGALNNLEEVLGPVKCLFLWKPSGDGFSYKSDVFIPESMYYEYI